MGVSEAERFSCTLKFPGSFTIRSENRDIIGKMMDVLPTPTDGCLIGRLRFTCEPYSAIFDTTLSRICFPDTEDIVGDRYDGRTPNVYTRTRKIESFSFSLAFKQEGNVVSCTVKRGA